MVFPITWKLLGCLGHQWVEDSNCFCIIAIPSVPITYIRGSEGWHGLILWPRLVLNTQKSCFSFLGVGIMEAALPSFLFFP